MPIQNQANRRPTLLQRRYLVDRVFQGRFVILLLLFVVVFSASLAGGVYTALTRSIEESLYRSHFAMGSVWTLIGPTLIKVNAGVAIIALFVAVVAVAVLSRWGTRSLRAIVNEVDSIDSPVYEMQTGGTLSVWNDEALQAHDSLKKGFGGFVAIAGSLGSTIGRWEELASPNAQDNTVDELIVAVDSAIDALDENIGKYSL